MSSKCPTCGAPMQNNSCEYCGYKEAPAEVATTTTQVAQPFVAPQVVVQQIVQPQESTRSKIVALLLCIFLGWLGIHRFYVGKIGTGVLYFFTWGLFGIGWLIDLIVIALGSFKDDKDLPLR